MGHYCYTVISCSVNDADFAQKTARSHLQKKDERQGICTGFLKHVAEGKAYAEASKGSTITYGAVGNYVDIDSTVQELLPFFDDLWANEDDGMNDFDHALIFVNHEQAMKTEVREIVSREHTMDPECIVKGQEGARIRSYEAPWSWHQM